MAGLFIKKYMAVYKTDCGSIYVSQLTYDSKEDIFRMSRNVGNAVYAIIEIEREVVAGEGVFVDGIQESGDA